MTITKEFASKLAVAFVAVAMVFSAFASSAKAQTTEELQAMINDLLAQVAALQAQTGVSAGTGACVSIMAPLTIGATGGDVTALQNRLLADGQSIPAGATGYFGSQTQAALAAWQAAHGVAPAVGYYGPITKAAMDASCTPADDSDDTMDDDSDDDSDVTLSGEASLTKFETSSASDDEIEEGAEDAEIVEVDVEFSDGDAEISRIDLALVSAAASGDETDPWDTFEEISIWVDGDMVASMNTDDKDDYLDDDAGTLRFSGLDIIAMEDEEITITVAATLQNSIDGTDNGNTWTVSFDAMRYFDADGVASTDTTTDDLGGAGETFSIIEAGGDDELIAKSSSNDPDATTLKVEDNKKSDWYTVFVFDLDTDDSVNDITLDSIQLNVATTGATYSTLVDDAELVIDGTTIDDVTVVSTGNLATLTFDVDGDVTIDAGDRVEAELMLRFKSLSTANEGSTVKGSISSLTTSIVDAEGADDLGNSQLSGAATGDAHTLRTTGIITELTDDSAVVTVNDGNLNDYATFELEVEVTAFDQDVFISSDVATSVTYSFVDGSGVAFTPPTASTSVVLTSSADEGGADGNFWFEINEGETETVTLTITYTPVVANKQARLVLTALKFDETGTYVKTDDTTQTTLPASDYRTSVVTIVN